MKKALYICLLLSLPSLGWAQTNCSDPQAVNYNPTTTQNDGTSCIYPTTAHNPRVLTAIADKVNESSGLIVFRDRVWTHNDSGGEPEIYAIDSTDGHILQTIRLKGFTRDSIIDCEDLTQDADYIYLNDMGNNNGDRQNLRIYKIAKKDISEKENDSVPFGIIRFRYPQQTSFASSQTHNFDCEAFITYRDSIHLFSKNRGNLYTYHYLLPTTPGGVYDALRTDSFMVGGQITGAAINPENKQLALLGYVNLATPFFWLFWNFEPGHFFTGNARRFELPSPVVVGQTEALAYRNTHELLLSNENLQVVEQQLYSINTAQWTTNKSIISNIPETAKESCTVLFDTANQQLSIHTLTKVLLEIIEIGTGKTVYQNTIQQDYTLAIPSMNSGVFLVRLTDMATQKVKVQRFFNYSSIR